MSLSEIKNKLYKNEEEKDLTSHDASQFDPHVAQAPQKEMPKEADLWEEKQKGFNADQKKAIKKGAYVLGGVLAVILLLIVAFQAKNLSFSENRVIVSINGGSESDSGKLATYEIVCKNKNLVKLNNAVLKITYLKDF